MNTGIYCKYKRAFFYFFIFISQSFADREYVTWQTENDQFTREACDALLKQLKKQHLDPILDQLHGKEGAKVMFDDIVAGYKKIEQDYKARATGAKQVCAAVFFEFHPVNRVFYLELKIQTRNETN